MYKNEEYMEKQTFLWIPKYWIQKILHEWGIILLKSDRTWNCGDDHCAVASA